ncbi:hypothetical protein IC235_21690 [Hymenobacter sp. BT664]|uniref:Uncharacterized protein n=1 Tax=Hymenobacter montanus TaxID=2771359 RepID=A0A927BHF2_9BACT|nr:hypothetical protein [Hymenobacter montanus]MBD2770506.1 hypothetical protein [Hymenobacter montanus]
MPIHRELDKKLSKTYEPSARIDDVFKGYDITFLTNEHGEPVVLFFGRRRPDGIIAGERYTRTIKREPGSLAVKHSPGICRAKSCAKGGPSEFGWERGRSPRERTGTTCKCLRLVAGRVP